MTAYHSPGGSRDALDFCDAPLALAHASGGLGEVERHGMQVRGETLKLACLCLHGPASVSSMP